jgi:hypothetical protein
MRTIICIYVRLNRNSRQPSLVDRFVAINNTKSRAWDNLIWEIKWWNLILTIICISVETKSWLEIRVSHTLICIVNKTESRTWYHHNLRIYKKKCIFNSTLSRFIWRIKRHSDHRIPVCVTRPSYNMGLLTSSHRDLYPETKSINGWDILSLSI